MADRRSSFTELFAAIVPAAVVALAAAAITARYWYSRESRRKQTLNGNMLNLLHHLHRYAMTNDENFPLRIDQLIAEGYLPWIPDNPFIGGPMPLIEPGGKFIPGGFSYLPWTDAASGEVVAATLIGYGKFPTRSSDQLRIFPQMPKDLPWRYVEFIETTGYLPEINNLKVAG